MTTKKAPTTRIKKEPVSPPKKGGKRSFAETLDLFDTTSESEDNGHSIPSASGSSARLQPVMEIPQTRHSNQTPHQQSTGSSKKVWIDPSSDPNITVVLKAQFDIVVEAFRTMGKAVMQVRGE